MGPGSGLKIIFLERDKKYGGPIAENGMGENEMGVRSLERGGGWGVLPVDVYSPPRPPHATPRPRAATPSSLVCPGSPQAVFISPPHALPCR